VLRGTVYFSLLTISGKGARDRSEKKGRIGNKKKVERLHGKKKSGVWSSTKTRFLLD